MEGDLEKKLRMLERKAERERRARLEAERILDEKSLEIFRINEELKAANRELDDKVVERTRALSRAMAELTVSNRRFELVISASKAAIWEYRVKDGDLYFSPALLRIIGYEQGQLRLRPALALLHPQDREELLRKLRDRLGSAMPFEMECRILAANGEWRWFQLTGQGDWEESREGGRGRLLRIAGAITDVDDKVRHAAIIEHMAQYDFLTNIPNRAAFSAMLDSAIRSAQESGSGIAVLLIDLNNFKEINDTLGHTAGDEVLKQIAHRLQQSVKGFDFAARLGGDEFGIILQRITRKAQVGSVCTSLLETIHQPVEVDGLRVQLSASIGVTTYPGDARDSEQVLMQSDMAMYQAKRRPAREGAYVFYHSRFGSDLRRRRRLESAMNEALGAGEFCLHYQPEVRVADHEVVAAEALVRWHHPLRGHLLPGDFIPAAEENGLIVPIGDWVVQRACRDIAAWREKGRNLRIAINLSPVQFVYGDILRSVADALDAYGVPPHCLELEITESLLVNNLDRTRRVLAQLHELGVAISLDDFGSGYSSLTYLHQLPIDRIKIDRSFIERLEYDESSRIITRAIAALGRSLGLEVLGEGVETEGQLDFLQDVGCDYVQGFFIARPLPFDDVTRFIDGEVSSRPSVFAAPFAHH